METNPILEMVEAIAKSICDKPDIVKVTEVPGSASSIIDVRVAKEDLGKMIGKGGETAQSIRRIIYAASFKSKKRYNLDITSHE